MRYVVDAEKPFIVNTANSKTTGRGPNVWPTDEPVRTLTSAPGLRCGVAVNRAGHAQGGDRVEDVQEPMRTVTGANRGEKALATATLVQTGYGERAGQAPRALDIERRLGTVVSGGKHALVSAFLNEHANASTQRVIAVDEPMRTICGEVKGGHFGLVSAALVGVGGRAGDSRPRAVDEPTATITAKGDTAVGVAFLAKHYTGVVGSDLVDPIGTVTSTDHHSLVHAHLTKFRTGSTGSELDAPVPTITAGSKENQAGAPHALGLVTAHIQRDMGKSIGHAADAPLATTTAGGGGKSAVVASTS
jgi:DNA (cytosine-5)-methyltransferase 1